jgi:hypothetical protein
MPAAVHFGGETVLYVAADPQAVVSALRAEANGWTSLRDLDGNTTIVLGERVCFVGPITAEALDADPVLAEKEKACRRPADTGEDRYPL